MTRVVKVSPSGDVFKPDLRPSMSFRTSNRVAKKLYRQTFVSQKQIIGSEDYEREYISLRFEGMHDIKNDTIEGWEQYTDDLPWNVTKTSKGKFLMSGAFRYRYYFESTQNRLAMATMVFFQVDDVIEYCWKAATHALSLT